jgi:hypothetical protein
MVMNLIRGRDTHVAENYKRGLPHYVVGLDLGQASDYTAICVMDRQLKPIGKPESTHEWQNRGSLYDGSHRVAVWRTLVENVMTVRYLDRPPLRTSYTRIVEGVLDRIEALFSRDLYPNGGKVVLVIDATGVGRGVVDMFYSAANNRDLANVEISLMPCTITGSTGHAKIEDGFVRLPKHELIHTGGVIPMQTGRLKWGPRVKNRDVLEKELLTYTKKINIATGSTQFEPWREKEHDDLLFATCLAGWAWSKKTPSYLTQRRSEQYVELPTPEPGGYMPLTGTPLPPLP